MSSSASHGGPIVIDASAVLALLFEEPGADAVRDCLRSGLIGVVNLAEVLATLSDCGRRPCLLALAAELGAPALTADRSWTGLAEAAGVEVRVIR